MPNLQFNCNNCGELLTVATEQAGFVTYCNNCQAELIVPELDSQEIIPQQQDETPPEQQQDETPPEQQPTEAPKDLPNLMTGGDEREFLHESPSQILQRALKPRGERAKPIYKKTDDQSAARQDSAAQDDGSHPDAPPESSPKEVEAEPPQKAPPPVSETTPQHQTSVMPPPQEQDIAETEVYDPTALHGRSNLEEGYIEAHAGQLHIDSDVHAHAHTNEIPHTHHFPYTYNGVFQPFGEDALEAILADESPETAAAARSVQQGPTAWPCGIFAVLLNARISAYLPEQLPDIEMPTSMFGSVDKSILIFRKLQPTCIEIINEICAAFGKDFYYALEHNDIHRMANCIRRLDEPFQDFYDFMLDVQELDLPRKDPLPFLRNLILSWYPQVRNRIIDASYRLDHRSNLRPEQAQMSTINVSVIPAAIHRFNLALQNIPHT